MRDADDAALDALLKSASRPEAGDAFQQRLLVDFDAQGLKPQRVRSRFSWRDIFAPAGALAGLCAAGYFAGVASLGATASNGLEDSYASLEYAFEEVLPATSGEEALW
jgi:anti-sigma factor RsiW